MSSALDKSRGLYTQLPHSDPPKIAADICKQALGHMVETGVGPLGSHAAMQQHMCCFTTSKLGRPAKLQDLGSSLEALRTLCPGAEAVIAG